jgi:hypothetical protein
MMHFERTREDPIDHHEDGLHAAGCVDSEQHEGLMP